ncbi:MAG: FAD binding domain-containing protein, partial [Thermomicrobiales bacterium]|nr:FAD binding domain-containing protein [Thermomicrobiales bacterium]
MLRPFAIHQPCSVAEACDLLRQHGDDAAFYAGGTELLIVLKEHLAEIGHLIDIKRIPGLAGIALADNGSSLIIGALATHRAIERDSLVQQVLPALSALESHVANVRVRAAGTIGGNLCFADPHSDPATLLAALGATLRLDNGVRQRTVRAEAFTTDLMTTERDPDELLVSIAIPLPVAGTGVGYERIKLHERPTAAVAAVVSVDDGEIASARVVTGCVGDAPQRMREVEDALVGLPALEASAKSVRELFVATTLTYDTVFESAAYKRQLASAVGARA